MRTSLAFLTIVLMVSAVIAEKFGPEKVQVGKRKCTCSFDFTVSGGVAKGRGGCDKKCSGSVSSMELEGEEYVFTFGMSVKKGKVAIKGAMAEPIEGSGSGPGGPGGPGSGSGGPGGPGSGSGGPGGNGGGPTGGNGGGNGGGAMSSGNCANGFVLVCPEVGGSCQEGAHQICPLEMPAGRMMPPAPPVEQDEDCMCLPLVLMQLVMAHPEVMPMMRSFQDSEDLDRKAGDGDKFPTQAVQVGKKTCKCSFAFVVDGKKVKASGSCDKKCSGAVKTMELEGENFSYIFGMSVKKGKVAIKGAKATAVGGGESTTTGRPPIGGGGSGSGSGRPPIGGGGSGSGMPGGGMGSGCVCVMAPGGHGGHGSGSGVTPVTMPTGETPVTILPTEATTGGSGSGSGETPVTMPTVATTLAPGGNGTGTLPPVTPVTTATPLPPGPTGPIEILTRVRFELFPGSGAPVESVLFDGTTVELPNDSQFDPSKPLKVVIHGWTESSLVAGQVQDDNQMPRGWAEDYHGAGMDFSVLGVHWVPKAGWGDPNNPEAEDTANTVSLLLYSLARNYNLSMDKVHMTGFSMGTVVTSWTAKKVQELGLVPLGRTTLLDPCIAELATIVSKSDATMVDVIHTSALGICSEEPLGHVDFFVNGGRVQVCGSGSCSCLFGGQVCDKCYFGRPRCSTWGWLGAGWEESHMRAVQLYRESIRAQQGRDQTFPSWRCDSYPAMQADSEQCPYDVTLPLVAMGEHLLDRGRPDEGVYFLKTNGEAPFSYKSYEN